MPIHRTQHTDNFSQYHNAIWDADNLTADDKLLLIYLLSKPPEWKIYPKGDLIKNQTGLGRDRIYRSLKNLIKNKYAETISERGPDRRFKKHEYHIYERPLPDIQDVVPATSSKPGSGKPGSGKFGSGKFGSGNSGQLSNTDLSNTNFNNIDLSNTDNTQTKANSKAVENTFARDAMDLALAWTEQVGYGTDLDLIRLKRQYGPSAICQAINNARLIEGFTSLSPAERVVLIDKILDTTKPETAAG